MDLKSSIKAYCLELMNNKLEEESTSGGAGGYLTKKAFRKPTKKDKNSPTGFESSPKPNMYTKTMKFKIVDPKARIDAKDLWKGEHLKESRYTQFKKSTSKPKPREILHRAIKEIQLKLDEVNRLIEFTTRIKGELQENDQEIEYLKRTKDSLYKIQDKLKEAFSNISKIN
jgi:hypothetical protein